MPAPTLVEITDRHFVLRIFADGNGELADSSVTTPLSREEGRYALRVLYEHGQGPESIEAIIAMLGAGSVCERADCRKQISRERRLRALDHGRPARWCSTRCLKTEAARRFRARRAAQ